MPEFHVLCVWCSGSFEATADTLDELVKLAQCHIEAVQQQSNHEPPDGETYPHSKEEILGSLMFSWDILYVIPFDNLRVVCEMLPPAGPTSGTATSQATPISEAEMKARRRRHFRRLEEPPMAHT